MTETYEPGELFVYMNGDHWELGEVKSANNTGTGYFCWYSTGDTAANTPTSHMHKLANAGWSHIEKLRELVRDMWRFTGAACKKHPRLFDPSAQGGQMVQPNMIEAFEQRMRELGVEV